MSNLLKAVVVLVFVVFVATLPRAFAAEDDDVETAVVVRKLKGRLMQPAPDYEVVTESDDVTGEPAPGLKGSYASWKLACADWKKELKELSGPQILSMNCGKPESEKLPDTTYIQRSKGTYKMRVKIRDSGKKSE